MVCINDVERQKHEQNILELAMTPGYESLKALTDEKIHSLNEQLTNPKTIPSGRKIEDIIDIQGAIKGVRLMVGLVESIKKKYQKQGDV